MNKKEILKKLNPLFLSGICHRGYHGNNIPENSLSAFSNAIKIGMAMEYDIHLTKDNELVVIHDSETKRVTGKDGIIENLTLQEIKNNYCLKDGSKIPTLKEVFNLVKEQVPQVIELKVYKKNYKKLAAKTKEFLTKNVINKSNFILISFDPRSLFPLKNTGFVRQLLLCEDRFDVYIFRHFFEGIDIEYTLLKKEKVFTCMTFMHYLFYNSDRIS